MIEYIQLRNFQSHKETELEFSPGVNVIVGESDHGKTAIMRAFYWAIFGKPAGDSMRRHGTKHDTEVTLETAEHQISRIRGTAKNQYIINDEILKGFGQNVPDPITMALNINEINFMRQMDPPFLFSKTAGEVAQYLNRLINLDVIDTSLSNIKRMHSQAEQQANGHNTEARRLEQALELFSWVDAAEKDVAKLEQKEKRIGRFKKTVEELDSLLDIVFDAQETVKETAYAKRLSVQVEGLLGRRLFLDKQKRITEQLENAISHVKHMQRNIARIPNVKGAEKAITTIEKGVMALDKQRAAYYHLKEIYQITEHTHNILQESIANHKQFSIQLKKAMPHICPLCEQEIQ